MQSKTLRTVQAFMKAGPIMKRRAECRSIALGELSWHKKRKLQNKN